MNFADDVIHAVTRAFEVLGAKGFTFRPMMRTGPVAKGRAYSLGHTSLKSKVVTVDILTARLRKPKKISAILAVLAHEIAHHQKPPYRQWYRGRFIMRRHFPKFYKQVNKNLASLKLDPVLKSLFD